MTKPTSDPDQNIGLVLSGTKINQTIDLNHISEENLNQLLLNTNITVLYKSKNSPNHASTDSVSLDINKIPKEHGELLIYKGNTAFIEKQYALIYSKSIHSIR